MFRLPYNDEESVSYALPVLNEIEYVKGAEAGLPRTVIIVSVYAHKQPIRQSESWVDGAYLAV